MTTKHGEPADRQRYLQLNQAFGLGTSDDVSATDIDASSISDLYLTRSFERNIGEQHEEIELALNAERELPALIARSSSDNTKWYQITSSTALRTVFAEAFGFPSTFANMPVDRQVAELKSGMVKMFGSADISALSEQENMDKLVKNYLIRTQINATGISTSYSTALTILRS